MRAKELEAIAEAACKVELEKRGMARSRRGVLERELVPGIAGNVGMPTTHGHSKQGRPWAGVAPVIGVRHEETARLVSDFRGLAPRASARGSMGSVARNLQDLIHSGEGRRPEWVLAEGDDPEDLARRVAEDAVFYGYPYMEQLRSPSALLAEMRLFPHNVVRQMDRAVLAMLCGEVEEARQVLMEKLPVAQDPTVWGDPKYGVFLDGFAAHFGVDLAVGSWPIREQKPQQSKIKLNIRQPGVVRLALLYVGRSDLAEAAANLTARQVLQIADRGSDILHDLRPRDYQKAIGMAAVELLESGLRR